MHRITFFRSCTWSLALFGAAACAGEPGSPAGDDLNAFPTSSPAAPTVAPGPATAPTQQTAPGNTAPTDAVGSSTPPGSNSADFPVPSGATQSPAPAPSEPDGTAPTTNETSDMGGPEQPVDSTDPTMPDTAQPASTDSEPDDSAVEEPAPEEPGTDEPEPSDPNPAPVGLNTGGVGPKRQFDVQFVGNITTAGNIRSDFLNYWDQITPENEGKWDAMEPSRDNMNWGTMDQIYDFAQSNGIPFKGHTLVWGSQEPGWVGGLSQTEQREEVEEWIRLFCERYPGATMIDVVNEPDHRPPTFLQALGGAGSTGYDWIIWSFETAKRYCPNAKLILNDYNVLRYDTDNFIKIARVVKDAGYLEAIGCQAHSLEDQPIAELERNLEKIAELGVPIYISEYDIDLADDDQQLAVMERQFPLFYESGWVEGITLWGYIHGNTWVPNSGLIRNGTPRPAMTWLMDYLGR